ncbi:MAG: PLP-dependent aminotransferase family protein, partial [Phenylobacterium sp.]
GELQAGDRLPPQRLVADRLGVDLTTVTRAYGAARERGLLEGAVGRGSFVRTPPADEAGVVDLTMNLPPPPQGVSLAQLLGDTAGAILRASDPAVLMSYHAEFGTRGQRTAGARWLSPALGEVAPERVLVAPGAQAGLAAILSALCRPGDAVVVDALTYPGMLSAARQLGLRLVGCPNDRNGMEPAALEAICARERAAVVYLIPTLQNPTAVTMPLRRRREIAAVTEAAGAWIVEDDPYSPLLDSAPPALAALAPDRTFHIATLAKCLSPGLRVAYLACPPEWTERIAAALRAIALMPAPLMVAVATRWINEGAARTLLGAVRAEARARRALAAQLLPQADGAAESIHVWLPLSQPQSAEHIRLRARERGLALVTAEDFAAGPDHPSGARISLGGAVTRTSLERALRAVGEVLAGGGPTRVIV